MSEQNFKELQHIHWCAIAWENYRKKPNCRLVKYRLGKIAKIFGINKTKFTGEQVRKALLNGERIAGSFNKKYVIEKSEELIGKYCCRYTKLNSKFSVLVTL